jgi:hypothetical protein
MLWFLAGLLCGAVVMIWWLGFHPRALMRFLGEGYLDALQDEINRRRRAGGGSGSLAGRSDNAG